MRLRPLLSAALVVAGFAVSGEAALSPAHQEWARGPVQFLMTAEETAKWKTIVSDDEAAAFVSLFWARRDPTPATARNEFREQFEARVDYAKKTFAAGERLGGAMSDRGKAYILFGTPRGAARSGGNRSHFDTSLENERDVVNWIEWDYEGERTKALFGESIKTIRFVDRYGNGEYKFERTFDFAALQPRAAALFISQPDLTAPPVFDASGRLPVAPRQTELVTASLKEAIAQAKAAPKPSSSSFVTWGEYVTPAGNTFLPVSLYVPAAAGLDANRELTFFGVIEDESGNRVAAFEDAAKLVASKSDFYVDRTLEALPAGKYRGWFGIAENGKPLTLTTAEMQLAGALDKDAAGVSQLLLSNNVYPLTAAQKPDDPYAFGGLKVVPKSDRVFRQSDELWYFVELRNPGVTEPPGDVVPIVGMPVPVPRVQVRIEVEGVDSAGNKKRMAAPLREVEALALKGVRGHYGVGNSMPLSSLKPGDYTFTMKLIDTVKKTSYTVSEKFRITE